MKRIMIVLLGLLLLAPASLAEITLPSVIGDHMVLQRGREVRVWGKDDPGQAVTVRFAGQEKQGQANERGDWSVMLGAMDASARGRTLTIAGSSTVEVKDVLVGEVWVASGQSNMQWTVAQAANAEQEIADSANDQVRMWTATRTVKSDPAFDVAGGWQVAGPETTGGFSAVGYYFARHLQQELGVPVGVLHASWGGTPVESWISREKMESIDWAGPLLERFDSAVASFDERLAEYEKQMDRWRVQRGGPANTGFGEGYAKPDFDDSQWDTIEVPKRWEDAGKQVDGVVWQRLTIDLPEGWAGQKLKLELGPIDDGDTTYVNNTRVGGIEPFRNNSWEQDRVYEVPGEVVKAGKLTIAVRVVDMAGFGGIWGQADQLRLSRADGQGQPVSLAGRWKFHHAHELEPGNGANQQPSRPFGPDHPHAPAGLYNGMIHPILPYAIRGAIWYQGESNANRAQQYRKLFPGLIEDWRDKWGQGEFPFLFVQLANYMEPTDEVVDHDWAHLRDAQLHTLRTVPNTGMATIIDIGEANDIHPRNKQDVGKRLALWALADTYDKDVVKSGPIYKPASVHDVGGSLLVYFDTDESKLAVREGQELHGFTIAGEDGKFVQAQASIGYGDIQEPVVTVWSDQVPNPVAVRYAWENNPTEANLVNEEGLPASPFRTDDWEGPTDGRR